MHADLELFWSVSTPFTYLSEVVACTCSVLTCECAVNFQRKCSDFELDIGCAWHQANILKTVCMRLQPGTHYHVVPHMLPM